MENLIENYRVKLRILHAEKKDLLVGIFQAALWFTALLKHKLEFKPNFWLTFFWFMFDHFIYLLQIASKFQFRKLIYTILGSCLAIFNIFQNKKTKNEINKF